MVDNLGYVMDVKIHMVILLLPVMLLMCVRNLKLLAPLSLFSNVITFVGKLLMEMLTRKWSRQLTTVHFVTTKISNVF